MTFPQIIERLRDGREYSFTHPHLKGHFHKAPYPSQDAHTARDGAHSAITFRDENGAPASPTLTLYDFDEDWWTLTVVPTTPDAA